MYIYVNVNDTFYFLPSIYSSILIPKGFRKYFTHVPLFGQAGCAASVHQ